LGKAFGKVIFNPFLKIAVSCKMTIYTKFLTPSGLIVNLSTLQLTTAL